MKFSLIYVTIYDGCKEDMQPNELPMFGDTNNYFQLFFSKSLYIIVYSKRPFTALKSAFTVHSYSRVRFIYEFTDSNLRICGPILAYKQISNSNMGSSNWNVYLCENEVCSREGV